MGELFVEDIGLSVRCARALHHAGIAKLNQLKDAPEGLLEEFSDELLAAVRRNKGRIIEHAANR